MQAKEHHPNREAQGGSIMLWGCFAAGETGALHKIDGIMRQENCVDILKQHLKTSVRKLKLGRKWVFQKDNELDTGASPPTPHILVRTSLCCSVKGVVHRVVRDLQFLVNF